MKKNYIYVTQEINSDGTIVQHGNLPKFGIGRTNSPIRRAKEHTHRGSKGTVGSGCLWDVQTPLSDIDIHKRLMSLGFFSVPRKNILYGKELSNKTEVFSGISDTAIPGLVNKGEVLSEALIMRIIKSNDPNAFKMPLILKPHQQEAYDFLISRFDMGVKNLLLNHKPRSGKSYITYKLLIKNSYNFRNVLLLTQYPILNTQWKRDFEKLKGHSYNILNFSDMDKDVPVVLDDVNPNLIMISLQDAKGNDKESNDEYIMNFLNKKKFNDIKNVEFDLIIFDEIHKGKETDKTDFLLENLNYKRLLGLSATPSKNIIRGTFEKENIHVYDLIKEREYKSKYGTKIYDLPDIRFNLLDFGDIKYELQYFKEEEYFTFSKFFRVDKDKDEDTGEYYNHRLHYYTDIQLFFKWVFGVGGRFRDNALDNIIGRADIENILIFVENNEALELLKKCLENNGTKFESYDIYCTNSTINNSKQLLKLVDDIDKKPGKSIIFANKQLTTGITLRKCDIVMLMNDWKSMDDYMQASYRCQSPSTTKRKRWTHVFDFNPSRSFNIFYDYIKCSAIYNNGNFNDILRDFLKCANINIYENSKFRDINFNEFNSKILENIHTSYNKFEKIISESINIRNLSDSLKNNILIFGNYLTEKNIKVKNVKLNEDSVDAGKNKESIKSDAQESHDNSDTELINSSDNIVMSNIVYILSKTPMMSLLLNFSQCNIDKIVDDIDKNDNLKEIYVDSLLLKTNVNFKTIYSTIKEIYSQIIFKSEIDEFLIAFNKKYDDNLDSYLKNNNIVVFIEETLKLIGTYIGISESEKKLLGEVFTPFELINEMLDTLPAEVWSNPYLKWLDPANGIGNFPIIIVKRLMEGLKEVEPDMDKRYKHIMNNMIYVCDINPKNMFIYNNLFDPNHSVKMNKYCVSFLDTEFDTYMKDEWKVEKFDIVVGNPPYTQMIDLDFINKSYSVSDKVLFVHPSTWLLDEKNKQKKFSKTKDLIKNDLSSIKLFNGNKLFGITLFVPCVITYIEKNKKFKKITCVDKINHVELLYDNIYDINKFSDFNYLELKNKVKSKSTDNLLNHKNLDCGLFYINMSQIRGNVILKDSDYSKMLQDDFYTLIPRDTIVSNTKNKHMFFSFNNIDSANNFLIYLKTNFCRFCLSMYKNNSQLDRGELEIIPWLDFNEEWTDEKLYKYFDLTQDEIDFINKHIPKYYL